MNFNRATDNFLRDLIDVVQLCVSVPPWLQSRLDALSKSAEITYAL
jgi:hypothetical protein